MRLSSEIALKYTSLQAILAEMDSALVAFSSGVDSTLLLKVAADVLGKNIVAVTVQSEIFPNFEFEEALDLVKKFNVSHTVLHAHVLTDKKVQSNPIDRCYWCKKSVFSKLVTMAHDQKLAWVADGTNVDDMTNDYRPGLRASKELGVRHPLAEAKLTKPEIRQLSRYLQLPTWDKPAYACLASRIPYGDALTEKNIRMIAEAEDYLHALGFREIRVRFHGDVARLEVPPNKIMVLARPAIREKVTTALYNIGFKYIAVDLKGYKMGSLNEGIPQ